MQKPKINKTKRERKKEDFLQNGLNLYIKYISWKLSFTKNVLNNGTDEYVQPAAALKATYNNNKALNGLTTIKYSVNDGFLLSSKVLIRAPLSFFDALRTETQMRNEHYETRITEWLRVRKLSFENHFFFK